MMRKLVLPIAAAALVVGGCTAEHESAQNAVARVDRASTAPLSFAKSQAPRTSAIAPLPDRGALLRYRSELGVVHRQAETYRAVELSEAHALNAARAGKSIELPTPSGQTMKIGFVRMEKGLDGNWSWVGRTAEGLDAVITFGDKAVFGRIAQRGTEALRLTTLSGRTWMVETDPSRMTDGNLLRNANRSDMVIPPGKIAGILASKRAAAKTTASDAAVSPSDTVDVVLGYTSGFVTKYGGDSAANTRLANLIALTNQAYVNSQISGRVRLVRTVAVTYTDSNSNDTALDALTGKTCTTSGCTDITVPAELVPLRTARETYGGDLVSLVRPFQAPQQGSCGVGWLLGGGGFTIDSTDAPFAYSVASDGNDIDETDGRNYFCREETLAHEMGHNMGQQHNVEDSGGDSGTHSYSYGYRESTSTGFYTIMAYRLANSSQFSINYFGNPSVTYTDTGRATGTATADNARSMNISMPIVAQFRNAVVPFVGKTRNDINGDGRSDFVLFNSNLFAYWLMNGSTVTNGVVVGGSVSGYQIKYTGDFNGDGRWEPVYQNASGNMWVWFLGTNGTTVTASEIGTPPSGWSVFATADVNGDGKTDLLLRNGNLLAYWLMNGAAVTQGVVVGGSVAGYQATWAGDFDGDGRAEIIYANAAGNMWRWALAANGTTVTATEIGTPAAGWSVFAVDDINGDGRSDLVLRNGTLLAYWLMNGSTVTNGVVVGGAGGSYVPTRTGDFDGDGRAEVIYEDTNRNMWRWALPAAGGVQASEVGTPATGWTVLNW